MSKIWEVDFTSFSGSTPVAYDRIGTQHLTTYSGVSVTALLPGFNFRPGVAFSMSSSNPHKYGLDSAGVTRALWRSSQYTRRSFTCWIFIKGPGSATWWSNSGDNGIWNSHDGSQYPIDGFGCDASGYLILLANSNPTPFAKTPLPVAEGWHHMVATVDTVSSILQFFVDGVLIKSATGTLSSAFQTDGRIGDGAPSFFDGTFQLGNVATYDHILTQTEVTSLYNTFLKDSAAGDSPLQTISGTVYGLDGNPVSSGTVYVMLDGSQTLQGVANISSSGTYVAYLPVSGTYTVTFSTGTSGTRAVSAVATSGGVSFV